MGRTVEEMTIAELQQLIALRRKLAKRAPKLRTEKAGLEKRLAEINALLAQAGPTRGRKPGAAKPAAKAAAKAPAAPVKRRKRRGKAKAAVKPAAKAPAPAAPKALMKYTPGKRLPRGAVQDAILAALGSNAMTAPEVAKIIAEKYIQGQSRKRIAVAMDKLFRAKKLLRPERGVYKKA